MKNSYSTIFSLFISFDFKMKTISSILLLISTIWIINLNNVNFFINFFNSKKFMNFFLQKEIKTNSFFKAQINNNGLLMMFFLIFNLNMASLSVFNFTLLSHLPFIFFMSISFWVAINLTNLYSKNQLFISHMTPMGSPMPLSPFLVIIETISNLIRPLTLVIRLMANLTAGHLILILCGSGFMFLGFLSIPLFLINVLEMMVSLIQAYVFMTLISMYSEEI